MFIQNVVTFLLRKYIFPNKIKDPFSLIGKYLLIFLRKSK